MALLDELHNSNNAMVIIFTVQPYPGWRKDFARFAEEMADHRIKVADCVVEPHEVLVCVITSNDDENELATELARRYFGDALLGLL